MTGSVRIAVHQMTSGIDPAANARDIADAISAASAEGASTYFAPEMSGLIDRNRRRAVTHIGVEADNLALKSAQAAAAKAGIWVHLGSVPVLSGGIDGRFANRSILIDDHGVIQARYDKMHLFDVDLTTGESWRESSAYAPGTEPVLAGSPLGPLGMTICYDLRFPDLFSALAKAGARVLAVPAAFTVPTGTAHWHVLLRARAIEAEAYVVAAAQSGEHADGRITYGHSLVIDPWGEVLLDMGQTSGLGYADLDLDKVDAVRSQIPVHQNRRDIGPVRLV